MNHDIVQRKLKAILIADVNDYTKLMMDDDEYTVETISEYRRIIGNLINNHQGRVVDSPGDNIMAEFDSALSAVNSAIEIQSTLKNENLRLPISRRMSFRIGISLGEIIQKNGRIYGDGVNIAARIQTIAKPGGVCMSMGIYDQVKKRIGVDVEDLGLYSIKSLPDPIMIYRICLSSENGEHGEQRTKVFPFPINRRLKVIALACFLIPGSVLLWILHAGDAQKDTATIEKPAIHRSMERSITVLPFINLTGDSGQEFLCCGIPEQIITALLSVPSVLVVASGATGFAPGRGRENTLSGMAECPARYILEGSVQSTSDRVRITARLVDLITRHYVWSQTFDREPTDMLALQDDIATTIIDGLKEKLFPSFGKMDEQHVEVIDMDVLCSEHGLVIE